LHLAYATSVLNPWPPTRWVRSYEGLRMMDSQSLWRRKRRRQRKRKLIF